MPDALAAAPLRTFRAAAADEVYAHGRPQLARLRAAGALYQPARGYYIVVPAGRRDGAWRPTIEAIGAGIGAAIFAPARTPLMSVSAARVHGAIPRALSIAIVAAPTQHRPIDLTDDVGQLRFVCRDVRRLDVESVAGELGRMLVTTVEQTVLDLARKPSLNVADDEIVGAVQALLPRCDENVLADLAAAQHRVAALSRARDWAAGRA